MVALIRIGWGVVLLAVPRLVLRTAGAPSQGRTPALVGRALGARQVSQGLLTLWRPTSLVRRGGVVVDGLHGAGGIALGVLDRRWRRIGFADAALAAAFMTSGFDSRVRNGSSATTRPASPGPVN